MYTSMGNCAATPVVALNWLSALVVESRSVLANGSGSSYQCSVIRARLTLVQACVLSSQVTSRLGDVVTFPPSSVTCQSYQILVPGGSEPDFSISHVQLTSTALAGLKSGKASADTVPQVRFSTPYWRITFWIVTLALVRCALK